MMGFRRTGTIKLLRDEFTMIPCLAGPVQTPSWACFLVPFIDQAEAMLNITNEQFSELEDDARLRFRARLAGWLRVRAEPSRSIDYLELIALIKRQEPRAVAYQIETERGIAKWCYLAVITAERFDQTAEVDAVLRDSRYGTPSQRLDAVMAGLMHAAHEYELGIRR
jgi:hypothetical protein